MKKYFYFKIVFPDLQNGSIMGKSQLIIHLSNFINQKTFYLILKTATI